jgi:hypothetical protein
VKVHLVENISQIDSVYGGAVYRRIEYNNSCEERETSALMMNKGNQDQAKKPFAFSKSKKSSQTRSGNAGRRKSQKGKTRTKRTIKLAI